jgi:hypothetical protein
MVINQREVHPEERVAFRQTNKWANDRAHCRRNLLRGPLQCLVRLIETPVFRFVELLAIHHGEHLLEDPLPKLGLFAASTIFLIQHAAKTSLEEETCSVL